MDRIKPYTLVPLMTAAACIQPTEMNDGIINELVDKVVALEEPNYQCVEINSQTIVVDYHSGYLREQWGIDPDDFSNAKLKSVARSVAVDRRMVEAEPKGVKAVVRGEPDTIDGSGSCTMRVKRPILEGDFAFMEFSEPGGAIGAYAFRRSFDDWEVAERVQFGWW